MDPYIQNNQTSEEALQNLLQRHNIIQQNYPQESGGAMNVMTDEQVDELRRQIVAYTVINENLLDMYNIFFAKQQALGPSTSGIVQNSSLEVPFMTSSGHVISTRSHKRWSPNPRHLQLLETYYDQYKGSPNRQKIKDISIELSQYGQITEANVYNWFQNRKARARKRKEKDESMSEDITRTDRVKTCTSAGNVPQEAIDNGNNNARTGASCTITGNVAQQSDDNGNSNVRSGSSGDSGETGVVPSQDLPNSSAGVTSGLENFLEDLDFSEEFFDGLFQ